MRPVIEFEHVHKSFPWTSLRPKTLKEAIISQLRFRKGAKPKRFDALKDVSFVVHEGETVGVMGCNGSGKSTILKLITGIIKPTAGKVAVVGRLSALLELGAGFHPDFSGRENVFLNGAILGIKRKDLEASFDRIIDFAEIGPFIDQPVKTYSSGMYMRLAFAIAVNIDPDILVIDEILAVGDWAFQQKCYEKLGEFRAAGKTILMVTHDHNAVSSLCDRAIWIDRGVKRMDGPALEVVEAYVDSQKALQLGLAAEPELPGLIQVDSIALVDNNDTPIESLAEHGHVRVRFRWTAMQEGEVSWCFTLFRIGDGICGGSISPPLTVTAGTRGEGAFTLADLAVAAGSYQLTIEPWVNGKPHPNDRVSAMLEVSSSWKGPGLWHLAGEWHQALERNPLMVPAAQGSVGCTLGSLTGIDDHRTSL